MFSFLFRPASRPRRAFLPVLFPGLKVSRFELFAMIIMYEITVRSILSLQSLIELNVLDAEDTNTFRVGDSLEGSQICDHERTLSEMKD